MERKKECEEAKKNKIISQDIGINTERVLYKEK